MNRILNLFRLTKREYFADFFITPPVTLVLAVVSLQHADIWWIVYFLLGVSAWTLYEYVIHRWVLHWLYGFKALHGLHHDRPRDYIATPPWVTVAMYVGFWLVFGFHGSAFPVGFAVGYVIYSAMHTAFHYADYRFMRRLKENHMVHHRFYDTNYGVTSLFWDRVFRTYVSK